MCVMQLRDQIVEHKTLYLANHAETSASGGPFNWSTQHFILD
jgi:hypothetical protein